MARPDHGREKSIRRGRWVLFPSALNWWLPPARLIERNAGGAGEQSVITSSCPPLISSDQWLLVRPTQPHLSYNSPACICFSDKPSASKDLTNKGCHCSSSSLCLCFLHTDTFWTELVILEPHGITCSHPIWIFPCRPEESRFCVKDLAQPEWKFASVRYGR